jgi:hypothetical protein
METIEKHKEWLLINSLMLLEDAYFHCDPEILLNQKNVIIHAPKYLIDFVSNGKTFKFKGHKVQIGYEDAIVIFDKENGFIHNRVFKYKI